MKYKRYTLSELVTIKYGKNQKISYHIMTGELMEYKTKKLYSELSVLIGQKGIIGKIKYIG